MVSHNGDSDVVKVEVVCKNSDDLVAVYDVAEFINHETAIAVAIVGDAKIKVIIDDELNKGFEVSGTAILVDIGIVLVAGMDELGLGAELLEDLSVDDTGSTVGTIHTDGEICKIGIAEIVG